jgi:DNA primase
MTIARSDIDKLRDACDLVEIASEFTQLKKSGKNFVGRCPFHSEKTPSFYINPDLGVYYCFGCKASGDVFSFVQQAEHLSFKETLKKLAQQKGIELHIDPTDASSKDEKSSFSKALEKAVQYYHEMLKTSDYAKLARAYLRSRKIDKVEVNKFNLGYAPKLKQPLTKVINFPGDILEKVGLGFYNERGTFVDSFQDRIIFPIFDTTGSPIALGGRILPALANQNIAKYKNSKETLLYQKRKVLYGLNLAKSSIVAKGFAVVCEGYFDVIAMHACGIDTAVAPCGTSLTDDHIKQLVRYTDTIVLAFDNDGAGIKATERLYEFQDKYEINLRVAILPKGLDPADIYLKDPKQLLESVNNSVELIDFVVDKAIEKYDLSSTAGRTKAVNSALKLISQYPSPIIQQIKLERLAQKLTVDLKVLKSRMKNASKSTLAPLQTTSRQRFGISGPEFEALKIAIHYPEEIAQFLTEDVFQNELTLEIYQALKQNLTLNDALNYLKEKNNEAAEVFSQLLVSEPKAQAIDVSRRVIQEAAQRRLKLFSSQLKESNTKSKEELQYLVELSKQIKLWLEKLKEPLETEGAILHLLSLLSVDI